MRTLENDSGKRDDHFHYVFFTALAIVCDHRPWFQALTLKHDIFHPAVKEAYIQYAMPVNWQQLLLEWPHKSVTDPNRLAYTQSERHGIEDRQTITTIGKYLNRHFDLPDHTIRDIVARHSSGSSTFKFLHTTADMVHAVNHGPYSCMCWRNRDYVRCTDGVARHPYEVYAPKYGWHMAVRVDAHDIVGRALCNDDDGQKYWVRSYKKDPNGGYSYSDEFLEAWLTAQGYTKRSEWAEDTRMEYFETKNEFLAPYIDGDMRSVDVGMGYLTIDSNGDYECDNTDGSPAGGDRSSCDCCGEYYHDSDMHWVGENGDGRVCEGCIDSEYTFVYGRRGNQYYVSNEYAIYCNDEYYDADYLDDNDIVCLADGDYACRDDAVYIESDGEWYDSDDSRIGYDEYNDCYQLLDNCIETDDKGWVYKENTWMCEATENWYSDAVDPVIIDGNKYHPDDAPETNETNEE